MPVRPLSRDQMWLLPPSLDEMIPPEHVVRFVAAFVDDLSLSALGLQQSDAPRGGLEYDLKLLLSAWLYGFMTGVRSTRRLEQLSYENLPMIWLLGGQHPDHSTLGRFLQRNRDAMKGLFRQTVRTAVQVGLVDFAFQAIDGTRVASVSSDKVWHRKELLALDERIERALKEMEQGTLHGEAQGDTERDVHRMPRELADPAALRERVRFALTELDRREAGRKTTKKGAVDAKTGEPKGPPISLADPEAILMKGRRGYLMGFNAQAAVDSQQQVIVAAEVVAQATDNAQQVPLLQAVQENTGQLAEVTALDGGYHSAENLEATEGLPTDLYVADPEMGRRVGSRTPFHKDAFRYESDTDTFVCPQGQILAFEHQYRDQRHAGRLIRVYRCHTCHNCGYLSLCTQDRRGRAVRVRPQEQLLRGHREKMRGEQAKAFMRRRSAVVEPVFGILKEHLGLSRFLRRGLDNARAEWQLLCAAHNLRKLWKRHIQVLRTAMD
ncbi:MAG: IS1182 family transposase [Anaerolineae bacterium]